MSTDIWDKYRHESDQTITVIGVLILSAKLCVADDHFSIKEEEEILKIVPHEPRQKKLLLKILDEAGNDSKPIEHHALQLKRFVGIRHPDFLEFVVAVLYRLANVDHVVSKEEEKDIRKVAEIFNIKKTYSDKFIEFFDDKLTKINNYIKQLLERINAKSK